MAPQNSAACPLSEAREVQLVLASKNKNRKNFPLDSVPLVCYISGMFKGHKITVEGFYISKQPTRGPNGGAAERARVAYLESFDLPPAAHHAHGQGALATVLRDLLPVRLAEKDKTFRGVLTHHIAHHANVEK